MKLKSITLENFRSFREKVAISDLSDVNIFIGGNNAGKSFSCNIEVWLL